MAKSSTSFSPEYWTPERKAALAQNNRDRVYTPELRAKVAENARHPHTIETREKMSKTRSKRGYRKINSLLRREHAALDLADCKCIAHTGRYRPRTGTRLENILIKVILKEYIETVPEKQFGRYRVDAYLPPPYHMAFEADGEYWHNKRRDAKRYCTLMERYGLPVVRFSEKELMEAVQ